MPEQPSDGDRDGTGAGANWCDHLDSLPPAIVLPMLGMLGGLCGEPVSVWLRGYPPDILGAIQRFVREHVPAERICEIFGPADIRRLSREASDFVIVLIYPVPGYSSAGLVAQWLLERSRQTRLPMVLLCGEQCDRESPGAVLSLRAGPTDIVKLRALLSAHPGPDRRVQTFLSRRKMSRMEVGFDALRALFSPGPDVLWTPGSLRAIQTLRGLLAGHSLLRRLVGRWDGIGPVAPDLDDYAAVGEILRRSRAGLLDESGDPIVAAMVRRGNLCLNRRDAASDVAVHGPGSGLMFAQAA